jgi:hypothetical protein
VSETSRREFLKGSALATAGMATGNLHDSSLLTAMEPVPQPAPGQQFTQPLSLNWLAGQPPPLATGVSWGVPWPKGSVRRETAFRLSNQGTDLPLQSWPLAYWPDGSIKWTGFATVLPAAAKGPFLLAPGSDRSATGAVIVTKGSDAITVDTGVLKCSIPLSGSDLIKSMTMGGKPIVGAAQLVCILQQGPETDADDSPRRERFLSEVQRVTVEQSGPVRAVVKIEGVHRGLTSKREWLPFTVRLYFYSGQTAVRLLHTIIFDGDQEKDFIRGLGLRFGVPLRDEPRNRTVRFASAEGGVWSEPLQPGGGNIAQENGQQFNGNPVFDKNAIWSDFKLTQANPHGFTITKRTNAQSTWLFSDAGKRAAGLAFAGDLQGGLSICVKDFWQSFPAGLEIRNGASPTAEMVAWLWSPDAPEMDMRFYDTKGHGLDAAYEDIQPGFSTPYGVARTSELTLYPTDSWRTRENTAALAHDANTPALLACTPEHVHSTGVFGVWSLPDRSTPFKKSMEDGLDSVLAFYERQVEDRSWYGFWQYGDFMHSYSAPRHVWHYDWGGHAWDNTELGAPLWLWYSYLRSGRYDLFRLAEAHLRNTSETDVYHLGPMKGLGTRHNVIKWGDGAKEVRISQAAHWRIFYFLTTDERAGDIMDMVAESAGDAISRYDPMREAAPATAGEPSVRIRIGPDWFALAGNWMTAWERTNDPRWQKLILAGVDSLVAMPYGLQTGKQTPNFRAAAAIVGFDKATGKLTPIPDQVTKAFAPVNYNLATIQGGAEVMFELVPLLGRKDFEAAWLRNCRIGRAPADVYARDTTTGNEGADAGYVLTGQAGPRLAAYAFAKTGDKAFAEKAISMLVEQRSGIATPHIIGGPNALNSIEEDAAISTNEAAQTGLSTIQLLELCKDQLPTEAPVRPVRAPRSGS